MRTSIQAGENALYQPWLDMIWQLGRAAEQRDGLAANHVVRVGYMSRAIARTLVLANRSAEALFLTAPLHDIGKIRIPAGILCKGGPLSSDESAVVRQHCSIGARMALENPQIGSLLLSLGSILSPSAAASGAGYLRMMAASIARQHHERWDGNGYPQGVDGAETTLESRIVALADAFDAMTSDRPYCPAYSEEWALETIYEESGSHFDPAVCEAFFKALPQIRLIRRRFADESSPSPASGAVDRLSATP
jgi:putative two-component system response regulator